MSPRTAAEYKSRAYSVLGVEPNRVLSAPRIQPLIRDLVKPPSYELGWRQALEALRASEIEEARQFLNRYDDPTLPLYCRKFLPIEAFAIASGMSPLILWETIVRALTRLNTYRGIALAAIAHPEIVETSIEQAKDPKGFRDREWQLKHAGFLPLPKGNVINVQATANAQSASQSAALAAPTPESTIRRLTDRFNDLREEVAATPMLEGATVDDDRTLSPATESVPSPLDMMRPSVRTGEDAYVESDTEE